MKNILSFSGKTIGIDHPTFFIADIAANHDGDIERAKDLIYLAASSGADVAKFQHFEAKTIVSDFGFKSLGVQKSHQSKWKKSVFEIYDDASTNKDWTFILKETCEEAGIIFFTSPYSFDLANYVDPFVPAYKIGSGDITWLDFIGHLAKKQKPCFLATGASNLVDVCRAVDHFLSINKQLCLMQCNTNYTGDPENFKYINLNVLQTFSKIYPNLILGLSDHTPGHASVLGAITLGARAIEKHFTDNTKRDGPDHAFAMDPITWKAMVNASRELEQCLGSGAKQIEDNELDTVILQRRSIRASKDLHSNKIISKDDIDFLRPAPLDSILPYEIDKVIGKKIVRNILSGDYLKWADLE